MTTKSIKINGKSYDPTELNETAKKMLGNIKVADKKLAELQQEVALITVARDTYGKALLANLPGQPDAPGKGNPPPTVTLN